MPTWLMLALVAGFVLVMILRRSMGKIPRQDARKLVEDGALLLDVRTPGEFASGHIADAVNIPVSELAGRLGELRDKQRTIVVYCRSGGRSAQAKQVLSAKGYDVRDLGAMSRWG